MAEQRKITIKIVKQLFALSGNLCAFPDCTERIVDSSDTIIGEICHIKGHKPNSARYDPKQTDAERRSFDNLILMCGKHNKIVDDNNNHHKYTVEWLRRVKAQHEAKHRHAKNAPPTSDAIRQFLAKKFVDTSEFDEPHYPQNLKALMRSLDEKFSKEEKEQKLVEARELLSKLESLPLVSRKFLRRLLERAESERMSVLLKEIENALGLSRRDLLEELSVLESRGLAEFDEEYGYIYIYSHVRFSPGKRERDSHLWIEIKWFCKSNGIELSDLVENLRFDLLDLKSPKAKNRV